MSLSKISQITGGVRKSHCTLTCRNDHLMSSTNIATDAKAWLQQQSDGRLSTHSDECHKWHHACLVNRLVGEVDRLKEINKDYARIVKASADEIKYLREQLELGG